MSIPFTMESGTARTGLLPKVASKLADSKEGDQV